MRTSPGHNKLFTITVILAFLSSLAFGLIGVWLVMAGDGGSSEIRFLGMEVKTGSVGVGCLALGAIIVIYPFKLIIQAIGQQSLLDAERKAELAKALEGLRHQVNEKKRQLETIKTRAMREVGDVGTKENRAKVTDSIKATCNQFLSELGQLESEAKSALTKTEKNDYDRITGQMTDRYYATLTEVDSLVTGHVKDSASWHSFLDGYKVGVTAFASALVAVGAGVWAYLQSSKKGPG